MFQHQQQNIKVVGNYQYNPRYCIGEGSYGKVFEGIDSRSNQVVAIKQMILKNFEKDQYLKQQLNVEIEILKKFNHKNVVKLLDIMYTQNSLYIVCEYCKDGDLRKIMNKTKMNETEAFIIISQLIDGFKELYNNAVIHRDLKPANILKDGDVYKIADFGFAKFVGNFNTSLLKSCVGSPLYMAPQILARKTYSTKCDIWSIGVIFYEMLTGETPWKGYDEKDLLRNIISKKLTIRNATISKFCEDLLRRILILEEKDRISWEELFEVNDVQIKTNNPNAGLTGNMFNNSQNINNSSNNPAQNNYVSNNFMSNKQNTSAVNEEQKKKNDIAQFVKFLENLRVDLNFKSFVISELDVYKEIILEVLEQEQNDQEILYDKFVLLNCYIIKNSSEFLRKETIEKFPNMQGDQKICFDSFLKENQNHEDQFQNIQQQLQDGSNDSLKQDIDFQNLIEGEYNDRKNQQIQAQISQIGLSFIKIINGYLKKQQINQKHFKENMSLQEKIKILLQNLDYLMDILKLYGKKGKLDNGFDNIHLEKQDISNNFFRYMDNTIQKSSGIEKYLR